jgi:hypothetical protein
LSLITAKRSDKTRHQQIAVVAEFHAYKIHPARIAFRTGIKQTLIDDLIAGRAEPKLFAYLLKQSRTNRRNRNLKACQRKTGAQRRSLEEQFEREI